jgi:hypothetical protein
MKKKKCKMGNTMGRLFKFAQKRYIFHFSSGIFIYLHRFLTRVAAPQKKFNSTEKGHKKKEGNKP